MKSSIILITFVSFVLNSCQTISSHGQYVDKSIIAKLENKRLTKLEVENLVGTPSIIPNYEPNKWYYVERLTSKRAWFNPKVETQRIVMVKFDQRDILEEVQVLNQSHKDDIKIENEYTKTYGTEENGLQTFVKNIGRFNKTKEAKKKKKSNNVN